MSVPVLSVEQFYTAVDRYMDRVDPGWREEQFRAQAPREEARLGELLGPAAGRAALDCTCGTGGQAIPLARLGWRVTGTDATPAAVETARRRASEAGVDVAWRVADVRAVGGIFPGEFEWAISCMALDNLVEDEAIVEGLRGMRDALAPGGRCYVRLRNFDQVMAVRPRYDFREERAVPHGRVIRLEDFLYESDSHVTCVYVYLREDERKSGYRWETTTFAWRRRALRGAELEGLMRRAGLEEVTRLPEQSAWAPHEVIATRGRS
jgi:glycine/sarcosine N-methyltransferase